MLAWLSVLIVPCTVASSGQTISAAPTASTEIEVDNAHHQESSTYQVASPNHHDNDSDRGGAKALVETNDECHGGHDTAGPMESGCCCDVTALSGTGTVAEKLQQFSTVFLVSVDQNVIQPQYQVRVVSEYHGPPGHRSSPPIYLSTQRFRI